jgi:putative transposase
VSESWFYKWNSRQQQRESTPAEQRRAGLDAAVAEAFEAARGCTVLRVFSLIYALLAGW